MGRAEYFDPVSQSRKPIKSGSIVNDVGLEYTPEDVKAIDDDLVAHKADNVQHIPFAIASGTNSYVVNIPEVTSLIEGMSVKVKFTSANTGACTLDINELGAKTIQKSNGSALSSGNIKTGQIVHLAYTGTSFQLLGEGGEYGTAQASHVLAPNTIGTESGIVTGTMVNRGTVTRTLSTQGGSYTIPSGYHSGSGKVTASFSNLSAGNIRSGVNIGGVTGTYSAGVGSVEQVLNSDINLSSSGTLVYTIPASRVNDLFVVFMRYNAGFSDYRYYNRREVYYKGNQLHSIYEGTSAGGVTLTSNKFYLQGLRSDSTHKVQILAIKIS